MQGREIRSTRLTLAIAALLCLLASPAVAGDRPWEQERWDTVVAGFDSGEGDLFSNQPWLEFQSRDDDSHESEYGEGLSLNLEENFLFNIHSPFAGEWAPGFAFELRF